MKDLQDLLTRVITIRDLASNQPIDENTYIELLYAFELYSKYVDEHNIDWKLLDLVKCMESLGNMNNILNGDSNRCQSAGKIIYALDIIKDEEKKLIDHTCRLRSNRAAHSPTGVSIDKKVLSDLQKLSRRIIKDSLFRVS